MTYPCAQVWGDEKAEATHALMDDAARKGEGQLCPGVHPGFECPVTRKLNTVQDGEPGDG